MRKNLKKARQDKGLTQQKTSITEITPDYFLPENIPLVHITFAASTKEEAHKRLLGKILKK